MLFSTVAYDNKAPVQGGIFYIEQEAIVELLTGKPKKKINHIPVIGKESEQLVNDDDRESRVALCAYYKAEARGYELGHEIQDWLDAEAEIISESEK
jgi:hypothetical protein